MPERDENFPVQEKAEVATEKQDNIEKMEEEEEDAGGGGGGGANKRRGKRKRKIGRMIGE